MSNDLSADDRREIENHNGSYKMLWKIYGGSKGLRKSKFFWGAIVVDLIIMLALYFTKFSTAYDVIVYLTDKVLSILPNIIGFNIGAYALIIGFGHRDIIEKMTGSKDNEFSLFQKMGGTFAISVIIQSIAIVLAFLLDFFLSNFKINVFGISILPKITNFIVLVCFQFISLYSIFLIPQIVLNVFGFSQLYHFYTKQDLKKKKEEELRRQSQENSV